MLYSVAAVTALLLLVDACGEKNLRRRSASAELPLRPGTVQLRLHHTGVPVRDMAALVGQTAVLPCHVDTERCSDLHSIKWYRGSSRIFVFSEKAKISRAEGDYAERAEMRYKPNGTLSQLEIRDVQIPDEAVYKCEITYIEVRDGCAVVQFINLTTLIAPEFVKVTKMDGSELRNGTAIGPFREGDVVTLVCQSGGGKPIPSVSWWNGTSRLKARYEQKPVSSGAGTGVAMLEATLMRGDLHALYQCRGHNDALETPLTASLQVLVHVRPQSLVLYGVAPHIIQGTNVAASCVVSGANPKATITWYNGTDVIKATDEDIVKEEEDGTFTTTSHFSFKATLYENGRTLVCEATNPVLQEREDKNIKETVNLQVLYPPIVTVSPENITVNESTDIHLQCKYVANPIRLKAVRWYRDSQLLSLTPDHFEGGTVKDTSLLIRNASRHDQGVYDCGLENDVGAQNSTNSIFVSIYFKPVVHLTMDPPPPVKERARLNVSLLCEVEAGNPPLLTAVRWYLDGDILKELPDCDNSTDLFCDVDPSRLLLEDVGRGFQANYSCEGMNEAGWGPLSLEQELTVYYPPGPATLVYEPSKVVKKGSVTLSCAVEDLGRPELIKYRWIRGLHHMHNMTMANWTIDPVTLETDSNFTCLAYNEGGEGEPATVYIKVDAPPAFIERTPPYYGALLTAQFVNISCRVECSPICEVNWLKNNAIIEFKNSSSSLYTVTNKLLPPNTSANDFSSIQSTLHWNMSAWPGGQLDIVNDNANYTCLSTSNSVGPGVSSTTFFGVEYPPENMTVSKTIVYVTEGNIPEKVTCNAKAYPETTYLWRKESENDVSMKGKTLILNYPLMRNDGGDYICEASNRHGSLSTKITINVLFKPECSITQLEMDGKLHLTCSAKANPSEVDFLWRIKDENGTIEEDIDKRGQQSILTLDSHVENFRTYLCFSNNSVGTGIPCERDITAFQERSSKFRHTDHILTWWGKFEGDHLTLIIAITIGAIFVVMIACIVITVACRRKREDDKYSNPMELEEIKNPEGNAPITTALNEAHLVCKWPFRPGVIVHVNKPSSINFHEQHQVSFDSIYNSTSQNYSPHLSSISKPKSSDSINEKLNSYELRQSHLVNFSTLRSDNLLHKRRNGTKSFMDNGFKFQGDSLTRVSHKKYRDPNRTTFNSNLKTGTISPPENCLSREDVSSLQADLTIHHSRLSLQKSHLKPNHLYIFDKTPSPNETTNIHQMASRYSSRSSERNCDSLYPPVRLQYQQPYYPEDNSTYPDLAMSTFGGNSKFQPRHYKQPVKQ